MAPDTPLPSDLLHRFDTVARHMAYLDRRFDDTNHRLGVTERSIVALLDDIGVQVDTALAHSLRRQVTVVVCALACQLALLVALVAVLQPWS